MVSSIYYPPAAFYFEARFSGATGNIDTQFSEVSGLDAERSVTELREGGENRFLHRLPGPVKPGLLVLKRGLMAAHSEVFKWCKESLESDLGTPLETKTVVVSLLNQMAQPMIRWSVADAWPAKWNVGALDAQKSSVAVETLALAYSTLQRKQNTLLPQGGTFSPAQ